MEAPSGYKLERKWSLTHFLIGIFGAMAILGVMAKIFNFEGEVFGYVITWKPVMLVGFMGEAFVFILMGMMREFRYVPVDEDEEASAQGTAEQTSEGDLDMALAETDDKLSQESEQLVQKTRETRKALSDQLGALEKLSDLRSNLQEANDILSTQFGTLGTNMEDLASLVEAQVSMTQSVRQTQTDLAEQSEQLTEEIRETRRVVKTLRTQLAKTARRFEQFNAPATDGERAGVRSNSIQ